MNAYSQYAIISACKVRAMNCWFAVYDNWQLRRDLPSDYHDELLRLADEMDRQKLICWTEWRDLRKLADHAFLRSVAGEDYTSDHRGISSYGRTDAAPKPEQDFLRVQIESGQLS